MKLKCWAALVCLALLGVACSKVFGGGAAYVAEPSQKGTADTLSGTSWAGEGGNMKFTSTSSVELTPDPSNKAATAFPGVWQGSFSVFDGVVRINFHNVQVAVGAWDGQKLTIYNKEWKKVS